MGVRLPVEMEAPRVGGSGLTGRGRDSETWRERQKELTDLCKLSFKALKHDFKR